MEPSNLSHADQSTLLRHLSRSPVFAHVCDHDLQQLVGYATRAFASAGQPICAKDADAQALLVLHEGEYEIDGKSMVGLGRSGGMIIGIEAVMDQGDQGVNRAYGVSITALSEGSYFSIPCEAVQDVYRISPSFRGALRHRVDPPTRANSYRGAIVRFTSELSGDVAPPALVALLARLLASEVVQSFPERMLLVHQESPNRAPPDPMDISPGGARGKLFSVDASAEWVNPQLASYDYVFLDPAAPGLARIEPDIVVVLKPAAAPSVTSGLATPWVLETMVVEPTPARSSTVLVLENANPQNPLCAMDTCRVILDLDELRSRLRGEVPLASLDATSRKSLAQWARALTRRRTGLAIAGGGVYSMLGVYVIRQILAAGVPLDVITGVSGGCLVGGYYAALGLPGLDKLVSQGDCGALDAMSLGSFFCGGLMESFFRRSLGAHSIESLGPTQFYPGTTNLSTGEGVVAVAGPLALGMRASSSATPIFPATITNRQRLVDGVYSNNAPVQALRLFSADLSFGLNSYPPARFGVFPWVPDSVAQLAATVGLVNRGLTFTTAFNISIAISGRVQSDMAKFCYNAESLFPAPYLLVANFTRSTHVVESGRECVPLNDAIGAFVKRWHELENRSFLVRSSG
jgi:hypothetical protein